MNVVTSKSDWRKAQRDRLLQWLSSQGMDISPSRLWPAEYLRPPEWINAFLKRFREQQELLEPGLWGIFLPMPSEPPVEKFCQGLGKIRWVFPRMVQHGLQMRHTFFERRNFEWNPLGVWEPRVSHSTLVEKDQIKGIFLPGLGFDRQGQRMGRGGGYYDRFLEGFKGSRIAVAFSCQVHEDPLTSEVHDQKVDEIWTERERWVC